MANNTMGSGASSSTTTASKNQKPSTGSSSATTAATASTSSAKESTSTAPAASASTTAAATASTTSTAAATAAPSTPSASAPAAALNAASLKKLPRETSTKQTPAPPNSFQAYLERLDAEKQISYLMLGASEVLANFNVKRTHPYSFFFFKKKGYKQIFQPNKNIIVQEIKRRQPDAKPNQNNRSNDELMEMLRERWPLSEPDKEYVLQKEKSYRKVLLSALNPKDIINLDEMKDLVASPRAQGLTVPMSANNASSASRKRSIGETAGSSPSGGGRMSTLGSVTASASHGGSYYSSSNKRRASASNSSNGSSSGGALETMLIQAANECAGKLSYANLATTIEALKKERFELQREKLPLTQKHTPFNVQQTALIDNRIQEISDSIVTYEAKMSNGVVKV